MLEGYKAMAEYASAKMGFDIPWERVRAWARAGAVSVRRLHGVVYARSVDLDKALEDMDRPVAVKRS